MRCSILGFNQEKLLSIQTDEYKIDVEDLLLLDYIQRALASPKMQRIFNPANNQSFVWLSHAKILEDLPILDIKESMLKKRLNKLIHLGLIIAVKKSGLSGRGSKSYYTITELVEDLQNIDDTTKCKKLSVVERPSVKNYTSDNKLILDNKKLEDTTNVVSRTAEDSFLKSDISDKPKKKNLYQNCQDAIDEFTENEEVRDKLKEYLGIRLELAQDKPFGIRTFKSMLKKLRGFTESGTECIAIIQQSIDKQWATFYPLKEYKKYSRTKESFESMDIQETHHVSKEEKEAISLGIQF